jgi:hypothetical protein
MRAFWRRAGERGKGVGEEDSMVMEVASACGDFHDQADNVRT